MCVIYVKKKTLPFPQTMLRLVMYSFGRAQGGEGSPIFMMAFQLGSRCVREVCDMLLLSVGNV